jgi:hypothetical protein
MRALLILILALWSNAALAQAPNFYVGQPQQVTNQGTAAAAITPADNTPLTKGPTRALWISTATACTISLKLALDTATTSFSFLANQQTYLPVAAYVVQATGTTCSGIVGLW